MQAFVLKLIPPHLSFSAPRPPTLVCGVVPARRTRPWLLEQQPVVEHQSAHGAR